MVRQETLPLETGKDGLQKLYQSLPERCILLNLLFVFKSNYSLIGYITLCDH